MVIVPQRDPWYGKGLFQGDPWYGKNYTRETKGVILLLKETPDMGGVFITPYKKRPLSHLVLPFPHRSRCTAQVSRRKG